jgi:hypothetical protein
MITAIVNFKLRADLDRATARRLFEEAAPRYQNVPGLVRKYFLFGADGAGGGVYLWRDRETAERFYSAEWRAGIRARTGADPQIAYFESPVIVDNLAGRTETY